MKTRVPLAGTYRGYDILAFPPATSGGTALIEMLNILEGYDLKASGFGVGHDGAPGHRGDAARLSPTGRSYLGDPEFNPNMPIERLTSKAYAADLRKTIRLDQGVGLDADLVHLADRERRNDASVGR